MAVKNHKGSVLGVIIILSMMLAIITAVVANNTLHNFRTTNWAGKAGSTRYIAFGGLQHAMLKLRQNPKYNEEFTGSIPDQPDLYYRVVVKNQTSLIEVKSKTGLSQFLQPFDITEIPVNSAKIESQVMFQENGQVARSLSGVIGTAVWKPSGFVNAASAHSAMVMQGGSKTTAYDFTKYKDSDRDSQSIGLTSGYVDPILKGTDGAHVQTAELMMISDVSKAEGDVTMPPAVGGDAGSAMEAALKKRMQFSAPDLALVLPGQPTTPTAVTNYTGSLKNGAAASLNSFKSPYEAKEAIAVMTDFPGTTKTEEYTDKKGDKQTRTVTVPMTLPSNKAYKGISVPADQTLILTGGRYYISDEFKINGNIQIDSSKGDVIVYVGKTMTVNGQINFQGDPATMQVYFTDEDKPIDPKTGLPIVNGFSTLNLNPGSRSTMVASGANLISRVDGARLLGAVAAEAVWLKNKASVEYDINLKGRVMDGGSSWKLQGVYETVGQ